MGDSIKKFLDEVHLYKSKVEALIKVTIWTISWIGGIYILQGVTENKTLGSAYLIFTLSLLMEFCLKISEKKMVLSKILHTIFCVLCVLILMISIALLFDAPIKPNYYNSALNIPKIIIIWMWLDTIVLWLGEEPSFDRINSDNKDAKPNYENKETAKLFKEKLDNGALGTLNESEGKK